MKKEYTMLALECHSGEKISFNVAEIKLCARVLLEICVYNERPKDVPCGNTYLTEAS